MKDSVYFEAYDLEGYLRPHDHHGGGYDNIQAGMTLERVAESSYLETIGRHTSGCGGSRKAETENSLFLFQQGYTF